MTPERSQRIQEIYQAALELDSAERVAWLNEHCANDPELRREVESLLAAEAAETKEFLDATEVIKAAPKLRLANDPPSLVGRRVGPYKILREIGHGGMGAVFLAARDDDQFKQRVAIKLIKRGMDSDDILKRFRYERQILASLDHPNIARLLDGGATEDGLPYFVMEHIEGLPINKYCDARKLTTAERLNLFRTVCAAVHYAHQNLVVHRDIKPSNILVTEEGMVKLLDFGIAKVLNPELFPETMFPTRTWDRPMTPAYASPEQVRGQAVTTASDVYSLGVVLYELLTGQKPYEVKSWLPHEIERVVCEAEPERPSTAVVRATTGRGGQSTNPSSRARDVETEKLRKQLKGDLDNIVLMAMRKEPQRRYASVDQFSRDIQRHLEGRPVIARQDTVGYRAGKFIQRHKFGVIAAVLILATLVGGILMTVRQKRIAERRFNDVRQLANAVLFKYHDAIQNLPGSTPVREMMVKDALVYLDSLSREAAGDPSLQSELAAAYEKVGHVQGHPFHANLGDMTGALASHRKALAIRQSLAAADPSNQQVRQDLAMSYTYVADVLAETGDLNGALDNYGKTLEIYQAMSKADPSNIKLRSRVGVVLDRIGEMQFRTGDLKGSLENHLRSLAIAEEVVKANPDDKREKQNLSISFIKVGERYEENQDYQQALENYRKALAMHEELSAADENNAELRREIALIHDKIGVMQMKMGDREGAMSSHRRTEEIVEALLAKDPKNLLLRGDLTLAQDHLGDLLSAENDVTGALRNYQKSLAVREEVWRDNPNITDAGRYTAISQNKIGDLLFKTGDLDGALQRYLKAAPIDEGLVKTDPQNVLFRRDLAESYSNVAKVHAALAAKTNQAERWRQAKEWYERSLEVWRELHSRNALKPADAEAMEKVKSEIARCEAALAKTL